MRLNKFIAQALGISRRNADEYIEREEVTVNDAPAKLGMPVSDNDIVKVYGKLISQQKMQYVLFHKPVGYVSSRKKQGETPTIYDILPADLHQLKLVGRLDKDSSGVMLLTNDGDYAHTLLHPSHHKQKNYEVKLDKALEARDHAAITSGVELHDGPSALKLSGTGKEWRVAMHEGRNRQIRRTFARRGYTVVALHRTTFGPHELGGLNPGECKTIATPDY